MNIKKFLLLLFFVFSPFSAFASGISPTTIPDGSTVITSTDANAGLQYEVYNPSSVIISEFTDADTPIPFNDIIGAPNFVNGTWHAVLVDTGIDNFCSTSSYEECLTDPSFVADNDLIVGSEPPPPPPAPAATSSYSTSSSPLANVVFPFEIFLTVIISAAFVLKYIFRVQ